MIIISEVSNHYHFIGKFVWSIRYPVSYFSLFLESKSLGIKKFPAVAVKTKLQDRFQTVLCYEGFLDTAMLMGLVQSVLVACEAEIAQAAEISATRALQSEQDAAYLRSLEIDKEKLRKRRTESSEIIESAFTESIENMSSTITEITDIVDSSRSVESNVNFKLNERIIKARMDLEDEPIDGNIFKFQFLFPDGTRKIRKFPSSSTTKVRDSFVWLLISFLYFPVIMII